MRQAIELIHDEDYAQATATGLVVVDFRMDFCPGCERMDFVLNRLAQTYRGQARFVALSINQDFRVAEAIGVQSAPTVLVKQDGQIVAHFFGAQPQRKVETVLQRYLPKAVG
ncbi:thioredoxin family protein [Lacticaseibacillus sp. GG6-2]